MGSTCLKLDILRCVICRDRLGKRAGSRGQEIWRAAKVGRGLWRRKKAIDHLIFLRSPVLIRACWLFSATDFPFQRIASSMNCWLIYTHNVRYTSEHRGCRVNISCDVEAIGNNHVHWHILDSETRRMSLGTGKSHCIASNSDTWMPRINDDPWSPRWFSEVCPLRPIGIAVSPTS